MNTGWYSSLKLCTGLSPDTESTLLTTSNSVIRPCVLAIMSSFVKKIGAAEATPKLNKNYTDCLMLIAQA